MRNLTSRVASILSVHENVVLLTTSIFESKFKCPCHGSGFRMTGIHFEGPAPRPLERFKIGLANDGQILVDKTKSFKWEKGEWENPESFLKV